MIKSFRGRLAEMTSVDEIQTIRLSTNNGLTGYRIVKLQLFPNAPGATIQESLVKLHSVKPTSITTTVNFDNPTLLASAYLALNASAYYATDMITIFDNTIVNQDIYITHSDIVGTTPCNYYLEMEQVKLDLNEATVATLKDMRGRE